MKKTKNRILATFLSFCMVLTLLPTMAFAEETNSSGESVTVTYDWEAISGDTVVDNAVADDPVADDPVSDDPVADDPVADDPVSDDPVSDDPVADDPVSDDPVADDPVSDDPVSDAPVVDDPVSDDPVADDPVADDPVSDDPVSDDPEADEAEEDPAEAEVMGDIIAEIMAEAPDSSITITPTYSGTVDSDTVTATDEATITMVVNITKEQQAGSTLTIEIPRGVDLLTAPGVTVSDKVVTPAADTTFSTYFVGSMPTWTANVTNDSNASATIIPNASGKLVYDLTNISAMDFQLTMSVNSRFVPLSDSGISTVSLGDFKITLAQDTFDDVTKAVTIKATSQVDNLRFGDLTVREYASTSLDTLASSSVVLNGVNVNAIKTNLMENNVDTVKLSTSVLIDSPFEDVYATQVATDISFELTVPGGATAVANGNYTVTLKAGTTNVYTVSTVGTSAGVSSSGSVGMSTFVIVDLDPYDTGEVVVAGEEFDFTLSNLTFTQRNYYDIANEKFTTYTFSAGEDTATASISVLDDVTTYALTITDGGNKTQTNNFYDEEDGDTVATYWENLADDSDLLQAQILHTLRREFEKVEVPATTDSSISLLPVQMSYVANKIVYEEGEDAAYLDFVNYVNFDVPFIGTGAPRQSAELLALTVTTEVYDVLNTEDGVYPYGTKGTKTYEFTSGEISAFMNSITGDETQIGSYTFGGGLAIGSGTNAGIVEYHWAYQRTPMFKVKAPEGESIIGVVAEFSGDNNSFYYNSTGYDYKMIGYPKSPETDGRRSSYTYTVIQDSDDDGSFTDDEATIATATGGFAWEAPEEFLLTVTDTSKTDLTYLFNTAEVNLISSGTIRTYSMTGYHNLGSVSVINNTEALPKVDIVATADIDTTSNDIVKEIYFPYIATHSKVEAITYEFDDGSTTGAEISYTDTYGIITAPEGKSFTEFSVTIDGWTNLTTASVFELRGYLNDSNELLSIDSENGETHVDSADAHTLTVTPQPSTATVPMPVDTTLKIATTSYANMRAEGTQDTNAFGDTGLEECNILSPGSTTDIEFKLFGGEYQDRDDSSWHDIEFTIVLPQSISLNSISAGHFNLEHLTSLGAAYQYVDTGETVSDLEQIGKPIVLTEAEAQAYFTEKAGQVKGATIYKYKVSDEDVNLYWARYASGDWDTFANFTVTMNVTIDIQAEGIVIPWSEVLILGTSCELVTAFEASYGKKDENAFDGAQVSAASVADKNENVVAGVTSNVVVGGSDVYLFIDGEPMVSVQDAYIEKNGTEYHYHHGDTDDDNVATFLKGESGILHFSIIDTVSDDFDGSTVYGNTNYVLFPLPTGTTSNALQTDDDFSVTINSMTAALRSSSTTTYATPTYSAVYVNLTEGAIGSLNSNALATLYSSNSTQTDVSKIGEYGANAILFAITDQDQFSTIDVAIGFTAPSDTAESTEYVELSGMTSYYSTVSGQALYYGGVAPTGTDSGNNYVRFAYYNPDLSVGYSAVYFQGTTKTTTASNILTATAVDYNSTISEPTAPTQTGYTFVDWYEDEDCTDEFGFSTKITGGITIYAKYTENEYTVTYTKADGSTSTDDMYWTDTFTLPTAPTVAGSEFAGWYCGQTEITSTTVYNTIDTTGADDLVITAKYTGNSYTVTYNLNGGSTTADKTEVSYSWGDDFALIAEPTLTGYTFGGWSTVKDDATDVVDFEDVDSDTTYSDVHDSLHPEDDEKSVTLYAIWAENEYDVQFKVGETVDTDDTVKIDWTGAFAGTDFPTDPVVAGSTFAGWYYGETEVVVGTDYADLDTTGEGGLVIVAKFTEKTGYKIDYHYEDGGNDVDLAVNVASWNTVVTLAAAPSLEGYTFAGWFTAASEGTEVTVTDTTTYGSLIADGDDEVKTLHLYAQWTPNEYTITFNVGTHSNEVITAITAKWDEDVTIPSTVSTTDEYTFANWMYGETPVMAGTHTFEEELGDILTDADKEDKAIQLVAKYTEDNHQIEFYDGTTEMSDLHEAYEATDLLSLPSYKMDGYTFDGWYTTSNFVEGTEIKSGTQFSDVFPDEDDDSTVNVYAKLTANIYTVVYDLQEGTTTSQTYGWSETIDFATDPTREGYTFVCWSKTEDGENQVTEGSSYEDTFGDTFGTLTETAYTYSGTVYAIWTPNTNTITYNLGYDGAVVPEAQDYGWEETITLPTASEVARSGYTFNGWYLDEAFTIPVTDGVYGTVIGTDADVTLYAKYTVNASGSSGGGGSSSSSSSDDEEEAVVEVVTEEVVVATTELDKENHFAYMFGYEDGSFGVDKNITRAEAFVMFGRLLVDKMDTTKTYSSSFTDVTSNLWYANAIGYLEQYGIVSGYDDGTFGGEKYITRAEFATIASRFESLVATDENAFYDVKDTHWALEYINSAAAKGWISGYEDGSFKAEQYITRAEAVCVVNNVLERDCDQNYVLENSTEIAKFNDLATSHWAYYNVMEATNSHEYTKQNDTETWISLD